MPDDLTKPYEPLILVLPRLQADRLDAAITSSDFKRIREDKHQVVYEEVVCLTT